MKIVFLSHPSFLPSQSMPRYINWLSQGMERLGHDVEVWSPKPKWYLIPAPGIIKKWLGYIDQYFLFPLYVRKRLASMPSNTLFVFSDQALGPWVPIVKHRPHVIHCHDFLAQKSALGLIRENPLSWTGKKYQNYIRKGYNSGKCFISVSANTQKDLSSFLNKQPMISSIVYNGLNQPFALSSNIAGTRELLTKEITIELTRGYILHVGGNQWYKNRDGLIEIYDAWRDMGGVLPLLLIGSTPNKKLLNTFNKSPYKNDIHFLTGKGDSFIIEAYRGASILLFPSIAEGFGWPIAEAMASGCPVITTNEAPMTEVGSNAAFYIPVKPSSGDNSSWTIKAAEVVMNALNLSIDERNNVIEKGLSNIKRFNSENSLKQIEAIYKDVVKMNFNLE